MILSILIYGICGVLVVIWDFVYYDRSFQEFNDFMVAVRLIVILLWPLFIGTGLWIKLKDKI